MAGPSSPQLGEVLRTFRLRAGLSQEALAESSGVSVRTISDLERGQRQSAHLETIRLLSGALGLTSDQHRQLVELAHPPASLTAPIPVRIGPSQWAASLPTPTAPIVGRGHEIDELLSLLGQQPGEIVTLTGPGGVGKTRLAVEVAHRLAPAYADGAAFVELAATTQVELVPDAIARALGMTPRSGSSAEQLTTFLRLRTLLLVIDNLEHVIASAPFIAQLSAACPQLTVLVTSRVRLRLSTERAIPIPPLSLADSNAPVEHLQASEAVQLFADRAQRVDPQFALSETNLTTVAEICRSVDSLPLAIELAASRLRILTAPALLERLDCRLPLLIGGDRDRPLRHQSMRETIAWSYDLLDAPAQRFLRWISVFNGGLSLEAAEALGHTFGLDPSETLETVTTLVESGLATRSGHSSDRPHYHLLETIREFGLEQLTATDELEAARRFHATHFLEFASRDAPRPFDQVSNAWIARLATEHANLISAFDFLSVPLSAEQSLQFAAAMGPYWHTRGPFSEWQVRLDRTLDIAAPEPTILKAHVLFWASLIRGISPEYQPALLAARQCIAVADQVGTLCDKAAALQVMAWVQECHEHWASALELREQAIEIWTLVGNSYMQAICLTHNAGIAYRLGDLDRARFEAEQAEALFRVLDNRDWIAGATWYLGLVAVARGRLDLGAVYYQRSLHAWLESESASRWYRPLVGIADVAAELGWFTAAARLLGSADAMIIAGGRSMTPFDRPGYERAETRCREALDRVEFESQRFTGTRMTPDDWLAEASVIVEAARTHAGPSNR